MGITEEAYKRSAQQPALLNPPPADAALLRAPLPAPVEPAPAAALLRGESPAPVQPFSATRSAVEAAPQNALGAAVNVRAPVPDPTEPALLRGKSPAPVQTFSAFRSAVDEAAPRLQAEQTQMRERLNAGKVDGNTFRHGMENNAGVDPATKARMQPPPAYKPTVSAGEALRNAAMDNSELQARFAPPAAAPQPNLPTAGEQLRNAPLGNDGMKLRLQATQGPQQPPVTPRSIAEAATRPPLAEAVAGRTPSIRYANEAGEALRNANPDQGVLRARLGAPAATIAEAANAAPMAGAGAPSAATLRAHVGLDAAPPGARPVTVPGTTPPASLPPAAAPVAPPSAAPAAATASPASLGDALRNARPDESVARARLGGGASEPMPAPGELRQQLGTRPAAAPGAATPSTIRSAAQSAVGSGEQWREFGSKVGDAAGKLREGANRVLSNKWVGRVAKPAAIIGGGVEMVNGINEGDTGKALLGGADALAGGALFTPAAPIAGVYLTGRGAWEGGKALGEKLPEPARDGIGSTINTMAQGVDKWFGTHLGVDDSALRAQQAQQAAPAAPVSKPAAGKSATPAAAAAAAAPAVPAAVPAAPLPTVATAFQGGGTGGSALAAAARQNALEQLDLATANDPNAVISAARVAGQAPAYYITAGGRTITPPAPATEADRQLAQRVAVLDNLKGQQGEGGVIEQDGKQYSVVQHGYDAAGLPAYRGVSLDGKAAGTGAGTTDLLNRYDAGQQRLAGLAPEDAQTVAGYHAREQQRRVIEAQYQHALAGGAPAATASAQASVKVKGHDTIGAKAGDYVPFNFVAKPDQRQNLQIFAHATAGAEGGDYSKIVGGGNLDDFGAHPQKVGMTTKDGKSTAAGRYQITGSTWNDVAEKRGYTDFSPRNQDDAFMALLAKHDALGDVMAGNFDAATAKLGPEWQGLPSGTSKNQGKRTPQQFQNLLQEARAMYARGAAPAAAAAPGTIAGGASAATAPGALAPFENHDVEVTQHGQTLVHRFRNDGDVAYTPQDVHNENVNRAVAQQALAKHPELAGRMTMVDGNPLFDNVAVPPNVLAGGGKALDAYLANVNQGQNFQANPAAGRIAEEAAKEHARRTPVPGELINNPEEVGQDMMGNPLIKTVPYVRQEDGSLKRAVAEPRKWPPVPPGAAAMLKKTPELAQEFDAKYGPGAAKKAMGK